MTTIQEGPRIARILVALDTSLASLAACESAANLAAGLGATLCGLFVEDVNLLRLAALPFSQEIASLSAVPRKLDVPTLERGLQLQASRLRKLLAQMAERSGVPWQFRISRGNVPSEVLGAAGEADLLCLGRVGAFVKHRQRLGSNARALVARASRPVVLGAVSRSADSPVAIVCSTSPVSQRAAALAGRLASALAQPVVVLPFGESSVEQAAAAGAATAVLAATECPVSIRPLPSATCDELIRLAQGIRPSVLVLPDDGRSCVNGGLERLAEQTDCAVVIVK